jgi:hypothetical protein
MKYGAHSLNLFQCVIENHESLGLLLLFLDKSKKSTIINILNTYTRDYLVQSKHF